MNRFLLIIAALLAAFLGWRWFNPVAAPDLEPVSSKGAGNGNIGELLDNMDRATRFPPLAAYHAISARPLFFNKRRPPPPYVPDKTGGKKPGPPRKTGKPRVQLSAIVRVGDQVYALVQGGRSKDSRRVRVNEDIDGWKVVRIDEDRLVLSNGSETETLLLRNYKPVKPVKQAAKKAAGGAARPGSKNRKHRAREAQPPPAGTRRR